MRGSVIDALCLFLEKQNIRDLYHLTSFEKRTVEQFLRTVRVEFTYRRPKTIKTISEVEWLSASDYGFDTEDGQTNVAVSSTLGYARGSTTNINVRHTFCGCSLGLCNTQIYHYSHDLGEMQLFLWSYSTLFPVSSIADLPQTLSSKG